MRRLVALCVAVVLLPACGGSRWGRRRPLGRRPGGAHAGMDTEGITIEPVDVDGAAAAYELGPSGTTFDEPATLTITVTVPHFSRVTIRMTPATDGRDDQRRYASGKIAVEASPSVVAGTPFDVMTLIEHLFPSHHHGFLDGSSNQVVFRHYRASGTL